MSVKGRSQIPSQRRLRNVGCEDTLEKIELLHRHVVYFRREWETVFLYLCLSLPLSLVRARDPRNERKHRRKKRKTDG